MDDSLINVAERHQQRLIDDELNRLPPKFRNPIVLHHMLGKTTKQVSQELRISTGTVEGRLKRGKTELRSRLAKHGVNLGVAVAGLQIARSTVQAAAVDSLAAETAQAALAYSTGGSPIGHVSEHAIRLAGKEMSTMTTSTTTVCCASVVLAVAVGLVGYTGMSPVIGQETSAGITTEISKLGPGDSRETKTFRVPAAEPAKVGGILEDTDTAGQSQIQQVKPGAGRVAEVVDYKQRSAAGVKIEAALSEQTEIEFLDTPLNDALEFLGQLHDIQVFVDQPALADEGLTNSEPVTLRLSGVSLKSSLRLMLKPHGLDYLIQNEVLTITTLTVAETTLDTRVYSIRHFLSDIDAEQLIEIMQRSIHPSSWTTSGSGGVATATPGCLVITQTQRAHEGVRDLLSQLERHQSSAVLPKKPGRPSTFINSSTNTGGTISGNLPGQR